MAWRHVRRLTPSFSLAVLVKALERKIYGVAVAYPDGGISVGGPDHNTGTIHASMCKTLNKDYLAMILRSDMIGHIAVRDLW